MSKNKDIDPTDKNDRYHGYQQWYWHGKLWLRCNWVHGLVIGYEENHNFKETSYYIR